MQKKEKVIALEKVIRKKSKISRKGVRFTKYPCENNASEKMKRSMNGEKTKCGVIENTQVVCEAYRETGSFKTGGAVLNSVLKKETMQRNCFGVAVCELSQLAGSPGWC